MVLKMGFIALAGILFRTSVSFAATALAVKVLNVRFLYIDAGSPPLSSYMTRVVMVVMLTFWVLVDAMSIAGRTEYRLAPAVAAFRR